MLTLNSTSLFAVIFGSIFLSIVSFYAAFFLVKDYIKKINILSACSIFCVSTLFFMLLFSSLPLLNPTTLLLLLFSICLVITAHTDTQTLLISPLCTLYLIPYALIGSYFNVLSCSLLQSIVGAALGALILLITAYCAQRYYGTEGLGHGDIDLLSCIGAFLGPLECLRILFLGSLLGSVWGIIFLIRQGKTARTMQLPFGTFLALAALIKILIIYQILPQLI